MAVTQWYTYVQLALRKDVEDWENSPGEESLVLLKPVTRSVDFNKAVLIVLCLVHIARPPRRFPTQDKSYKK